MNTKGPVGRLIALGLAALLLGYATPDIKVAAQTSPRVVVTRMAWSPDGTQIATGSADGTINTWNAQTGAALLTLTGHKYGTSDVAWSPDGKKLLSGSADGSLFVWDAVNGQILRQLPNKGAVTSLTWLRDGQRLLVGTGGEIGNLYLWDAETGQLIKEESRVDSSRMVWSPGPDNSQLAIVVTAGVFFYDSTFESSRGSIVQLEGYKKASYYLYAMAWSPDSKQVATGSLNGLVRVWDMGTRRLIKEMRGNDATEVHPETSAISTLLETSAISTLAFSADGSELFSLSTDGTLRGWVVATGQVLGTLKVKQPAVAYDAAWSAYGGRLAVGGALVSSSQVIPLQDFGNGVLQVVAPFPSVEELQGITQRCVAQAATKQTLVTHLTNHRLPEFISAIKTLSKEQIPPACAADLVAVAGALQQASK